MPDFTITIRPGHPDFLDLDWTRPVEEWDSARIVDLPRGISRHVVRFVSYRQGIYAVKELPTAPAHRDYEVLRELETKGAPAVLPVGLIDRRTTDPTAEASAALITRYEDFSFSYRELLEGPGFGQRRNQMLDAFASLLVELHTVGCFWGDCSLSNTLYRFDAETIETIMVDAETAAMFETLSDGQREEDLEIMIVNVAGGMADIASERDLDLDYADLALGEDIAERYRAVWAELTDSPSIASDERYRIAERVKRLNDLGFDVQEIDLMPSEGGQRLQMKVRAGGRTYHRTKLKELTGVEALDNQARQILDDLYYFQAKAPRDEPTLKALTSVQWRVGEFEPMLHRMRGLGEAIDPIQAYCDLLHFRYIKSVEAGHDVGTEAAFAAWVEAGRPGFPVE
ncbi:MAG: DUF4032 domain-containing protein [Acidimicrobiia bacterium]|nr:DUF4032 domain-containing protein [Acidimicrobiia bacterium]